MEWVVIPLIVFGVLLGELLLGRSERRYMKVLATREPVSDDDLAERFFCEQEVPRSLPGRVRQILAELMNYSALHMLPDDDLAFFWGELDGVELIIPLEKAFGVSITQEDVSKLRGVTIRSLTELVARKVSADPAWRTDKRLPKHQPR